MTGWPTMTHPPQPCRVRAMKQLCLTTLLAVLALAPAAAQDDASPAEANELYQVELLIFRHLDQSRTTTEIPQLVEPEIADVLDQQLPRLAVEGASAAARASRTAVAGGPAAEPLWRPVRAGRALAADADRLERLQAYGLVSHLAWIQTAPDIAVATELDIRELGAGAAMRGSVKLYSKRYLHLALDLELADDPAASSSLFPMPVQAQPTVLDSRRMRLGRTVYFDQPRFGVLAIVNKVETDNS